jgi:hypothetical protein
MLNAAGNSSFGNRLISTRRLVLPDALLQRREDFIASPVAGAEVRLRRWASEIELDARQDAQRGFFLNYDMRIKSAVKRGCVSALLFHQ